MEQCRGGCSHEMVNSPATAATMAYPTLEEEEEERRSSGDGHGNDHDDEQRRRHRHADANNDDANQHVDHRHRTEIERESHGSSPRPVSASSCPVEQQRDVVHDDDEPCTDRTDHHNHQHHHHHLTSTIHNRDFAHSYRAVPEECKSAPSQSSGATTSFDCVSSVESTERKPNARQRPRKQSQPRKVTWNQDFLDDDSFEELGGGAEEQHHDVTKEEETSPDDESAKSAEKQLDEMKERYRLQLTKRNLLKCRLCPDDAPARGAVCQPYHTKASLTLHKLWRHEKRKRALNPTIEDHPSSQVSSSITLKATVFTNPEYVYNR